MHATGSHAGTAPARAKLVLISLILVAAIANLNLAVATGADWAYTAGIVAILLGATLVYFRFPKEEEEQLLAAYHAEDTAQRPAEPTQLERPAVLPSSR